MRFQPYLTASLFALSLVVNLPPSNHPSLATFYPASVPIGESRCYVTAPIAQMQQPYQVAIRRGIPKRREGGGTRYV